VLTIFSSRKVWGNRSDTTMGLEK